MGDGARYKCSQCGEEYMVCTGRGFLFPMQFEEIQEAVRNGKYGQEWKNLVCSGKYVSVDAEEYVFVCDNCNHWVVEEELSVYEPNNPQLLAKRRFGEKTVEEWGGVPYATTEDFVEDYHLLKRRIHKCEKCGEEMHIATENEIDNLPCPCCGGAKDDKYISYICWD